MPVCRACGQDTMIDTAAGLVCVCGAGVEYVRAMRFGRKKKAKACRHQWGYIGTTMETGVRARKERCTVKGCIAARVTEVD